MSSFIDITNVISSHIEANLPAIASENVGSLANGAGIAYW